MRLVRSVCAALGLLLAVFAHPTQVQADCPLSCLRFSCSSRASADTAISNCCCYIQSGYNIPAGTLFTHINGGIADCPGEAKIEDDFVVDGLPTGTPVSLSARLDYSASWWCGNCVGGSGVNANITQGAHSATWNAPTCDPSSPDCSHSLNAALVLPVQAVAGTPFRASFEVWGDAAEALAGMYGTISFDNLPAHAVIHSCNGYVQGQVPTLPVSWGHLKAAYR